MRSILLILSIILLFSNAALTQALSTFGESNLPLVVIDTYGADIPDDPKINAHMGIIWNGDGNMNSTTDEFNNYDGLIGIEIRGSSSQMFPKKSYGLELHDAARRDTSCSLLGMPKEEDWILYAPYSDKTLIRNVLTFTLNAALGHYTTRCKFVELFVNEQYQGVYVLMEKIKRDKGRVDIAKLKPEDVTPEEITGGYIIKIDKWTGSGGDGWYSRYYNTNAKKTFFQYDYPKQEDLVALQKTYIRDYFHLMEKSLADRNFDGTNGFRELADEESFIDYLVINELAKNVDGYRLSTYLYKDKGGKLTLGPIWDFNLAYGNADYYHGQYTSGFQFQADLGSDDWQNPFWWEFLMDNNTFRSKLKNRWKSLRENELSSERITFVVDSLTSVIESAKNRNFTKWMILGQRVWPNAYVGYTYQSEVDWMNNWIKNRLSWLDNEIDGLYVGFNESAQIADISIYPNPFRNELNINLGTQSYKNVEISIFSITGTVVLHQQLPVSNGLIQLHEGDFSRFSSGVYVVQLKSNNNLIFNQRLIKGD